MAPNQDAPRYAGAREGGAPPGAAEHVLLIGIQAIAHRLWRERFFSTVKLAIAR